MAKKADSKSGIVSLDIEELKVFAKHIVTNNRYLLKQKKIPVSMEIEGDSGLGKTSAVIQLADELGLDFVKLNLAQIEELGDLVGFPIRQFQMSDKESNESWIDENAVDEYTKLGFKFTGKNRMSYCPPEWISGKTKGGILLLDDWNRADTRFIQAVMELIDRQQYISWKLPEDWHIMLTSNPDDGEYMVNAIDNAQKTRFISTKLKFDIKCWARWAEEAKLDSRCINFLILHPELVTKSVNPRSITTFFNSISSISDFDKNLPLIQMIGEGSVGDEFSSLFTMFINNKLDKLISPYDVINNEDEKQVINALKKIVGKDEEYRADLASTMSIRIANFSITMSKDETIPKSMIDRISNLIIHDEIFTNDLKYNMTKVIYNGNPTKFKSMLTNSKLQKMLLK